MKARLAMLALLLVLAPPGAVGAPPAPRPPVAPLPAGFREIIPQDAAILLDSGTLAGVLDLRMPEEEKLTGHLPGAVFIDLFNASFDSAIKALPWDHARPCLVYCALGGRSRQAAARLSALGFRDVHILKGGLHAWKAAGLPVVTR